MNPRKTLRAAAFAIAMAAAVQPALAEACLPEVSGVLDKQRESYIAAQSDLADQNFSRRPGSFASTTCLGDLMKGDGLDIFFKPPSLDSIIGMVKNLACQQASQIFSQLMSGSGVNGGSALKAGELLSGINLGGLGNGGGQLGSLLGSSGLSGSGSSGAGSIMGLFK